MSKTPVVVERLGLPDLDAIGAIIDAVFGHQDGEMGEYMRRAATAGRLRVPRDLLGVRSASAGALDAFVGSLPGALLVDGCRVPIAEAETVSTLPPTRGAGLCSALMREFEAEAVRSGASALLISGIPGFYRRFGFEYALSMPWHREVRWEQAREKEICNPSGTRYAATRVERGHEGEWIQRRSTRFASVVGVCTELESHTLGVLCSVPFVERPGRHNLTAELYDVRAEGSEDVVGQFAVATQWGSLFLRELWLHESHAAALECALATLRGRARDTGIGMVVVTPPQPAVSALLRAVAGDEDPRPYGWYIRMPQPVKVLRDLCPALERRAAAAGLRGVSVLFCFYDPRMDDALVSVGQDGRITIEARQFDIDHGGPEYKERDQLVLEMPHGAAAKMFFGDLAVDDLCRVFPDIRGHNRAIEICSLLFPRLQADVALTM
eukprot:m51a1_g3811 hypothetical protein (438) ;mRNA; f:255622-256935